MTELVAPIHLVEEGCFSRGDDLSWLLLLSGRTIRNTKTKQAYIIDTPLDQLASSGLIEWYTETDPQTNMSEFLKNEGYEFNRRRPWISELAKGTEFRFIRFFLWFSLSLTASIRLRVPQQTPRPGAEAGIPSFLQ